jgi:hypothetical protein
LRRLFAIALFSTFLFGTRPAAAADGVTVAILWPQNPSPQVVEALTRLQGELLSVGLRVAKSSQPASRGQEGAESRDWLEQVANERGARAVIDVVGDGVLLAIDVWVVKKEPGRFEVSRVEVEPNSTNPSERIALRAMDALRGSLVEIDWSAREPKPQPVETSTPPSPTPAAPVPANPRLDVEAGAALLTSLDGVGPAFMPLVRVGWAARPWLVLQTSIAGLGTRPQVEGATGQARVAQAFALLGGALRWRPDRFLWPFVSLSAGALRTSLSGQSGVLTQGHSLGQWSLLVDGAVGTGLRLSQRTFLTLAAHLQVAQPYVVVHILDSVAATSGRPNLLFTLTLGAWL